MLTAPWANAQVASPVSSDTPALASELNEAGFELYHAGDYRRALEKFLEAYALERAPSLLFNIARTYEALGDREAAIEKYQAFIDQETDNAAGRDKAQRAIERLQTDEASPSPGAAPATPRGSQSPGPRSNASRPNTPPSKPTAAEAPEPSRNYGWPLVALGGGALALGVGTTLYVLGVKDHQRVTDSVGGSDPSRVSPLTRSEATSLVTSGDRKKALGGVSLGVGGALVTTGIVLLLSRGDPDPHDDSAFTFGGEWLAHQGTLHLSGRF